MNFVMAMSFRDRIEALSEEEGNPEDADVLNKSLYHTILTGLKQNSIKMELHHDVKAASLSDVEFLEKVAMAEAKESERLGKVKAKAYIAALTENKTGSGAGNPSSALQPAAPKQKNNSREPENKQVLDKVDLLVSKIDSLTTYSE